MAALKSFDSKPLKRLTPSAAEAARNPVALSAAKRKYVRRAAARQFFKVENLLRDLERLPTTGETFHCVMSPATHDSWHLVPAVLKLAAPTAIADLWLATLGFNDAGMEALFAMLDGGQVLACSMIVSNYFRTVDHEIFDRLYEGLRSRGQRLAQVRSHAKLMLFGMADGSRYTVESSANLRSCKGHEQFTLTNDRGLFDFHRAWLAELIAMGGAHDTPQAAAT